MDLKESLKIVGRIPPQTVWDYLVQAKELGTKEILLIRLQPTSDSEAAAKYRRLFWDGLNKANSSKKKPLLTIPKIALLRLLDYTSWLVASSRNLGKAFFLCTTAKTVTKLKAMLYLILLQVPQRQGAARRGGQHVQEREGMLRSGPG